MLAYILGIAKQDNKGITNRGRFQELQIGAIWITNRGSLRDLKGFQIGVKRFQIGEREIKNRGRDFESGKRFQIREKRFQIETREIANWSRDFKSGQGLEIGAEQGCMQRQAFMV